MVQGDIEGENCRAKERSRWGPRRASLHELARPDRIGTFRARAMAETMTIRAMAGWTDFCFSWASRSPSSATAVTAHQPLALSNHIDRVCLSVYSLNQQAWERTQQSRYWINQNQQLNENSRPLARCGQGCQSSLCL